MCLADNTDHHRTLLDGFLCVFDLEDAALRRAVQLLDERWKQADGCSAHKVTESLS